MHSKGCNYVPIKFYSQNAAVVRFLPGLGEAPLGFLLDKTQATVQGPEFANGCALARAPVWPAAAGLWTGCKLDGAAASGPDSAFC